MRRIVDTVLNGSRLLFTNASPSGLGRVLLVFVCSALYSSCAQRVYTYDVLPASNGTILKPSEIGQACQIVDEIARSEGMQRVPETRPQVLRRYRKHSMTIINGEVNTYLGREIKAGGTVLDFAVSTDNFNESSLKLRLEGDLVGRFNAAFGDSRVVRVVHEVPRPVGY